jgi:hypothetical protein
MRRLAIALVVSLLAVLFPVINAATAAPGDTLSVSTTTDVTNLGPAEFATLAASADGSKIIAASNGSKAYRSSDFGRTWNELTALTSVIATAAWNVSASSADGSVLYLGAFGGFVYRSQDSGASWTQIGASRNWYQIATSSDGQIFYGAAGTAQLFRSTNFGTTISATVTTSVLDNVACSSDGQIVYIAESGLSIAKSTDAGLTFTSTASATPDWRWLATDSTGTRVLAAPWNAGTLYVSTNSGTSFTSVTAAGSRQWTALSVSGDGTKMMAGVRGGGSVYKSLDSGTTWSTVSGNSVLSSFASDISTDGTRFFISALRGITLWSGDSGATFSTPGVLPRFSGGYIQSTINWSADGSRAAALFCRTSAVCYVVTSPDGGQNFYFNLNLGGLPDGSTMAMAANGENIVVRNSGTRNFAISTNFGSTWAGSANPSAATATWAYLAISADGSKIVSSEDNGAIVYSSNSGTTFTVVNATVSRWLGVSMNADASVMLVNRYPLGIFRSADYGATWTNVQVQGSGDLQWTAIAATGNTAVASNWAGKLWISQDKGLTWATTSSSSTSNYNTVSVSADGSVIFASSFDNNIDYSLDSGATFTNLASAGVSQVSALSMSSDASKLMYVSGTGAGLSNRLFVANLSITRATVEYLGPVIERVDNRRPMPTGGEIITIKGKNLQNVNSLQIDGVATAIKTQTSSELSFVAPAHSVGTVAIYLANPNGKLNFVNGLTYALPVKTAAKLPAVPLSLKVGRSVTLKPVDSSFSSKVASATPRVCSVSGLKITARQTGKCIVTVTVSVSSENLLTKSNSGRFEIQVRR